MSKQTGKSLLITSSLPRFYQDLLSGIRDYTELENRVFKEIKLAHAFRQVEKVAELSQLLVNLPIKEFQLIGQYYGLWCRYRTPQYDINALEGIIDQTHTIKAQALLSRGAFEYDRKSNDAALCFFDEALKARPNTTEFISISVAIAVAKASEGFHKLALKDLESLIPIIKHAEPKLYFDFLNSYAVELGEAARRYEARNVIQRVLASPFAIAYPEWHETAEELKPPNRSFVAIPPPPPRKGKLLSMPIVGHAEPVKQDTPARVLNLLEWKKKMGKDNPPEKLNEKQMVVRMMNLLTGDSVTYAQLSKIMAYVRKVMSEPEESEPDKN